MWEKLNLIFLILSASTSTIQDEASTVASAASFLAKEFAAACSFKASFSIFFFSASAACAFSSRAFLNILVKTAKKERKRAMLTTSVYKVMSDLTSASAVSRKLFKTCNKTSYKYTVKNRFNKTQKKSGIR
ncbi:hypothetical protein Leryth_013224 [Lithospermum erythrorhizon]|nr:hypothetical protein Leryth_013224 [Lithospermum erythrorhizon]